MVDRVAPFALPQILLRLIEDLSPNIPPGFLRLVRRRFVARYADGTESLPFVYEEVDRRAIDAAVIAAYYEDSSGQVQVYLRSALRPPVVLRDKQRSPIPELDPAGSIWELPAGLVEPHEQTLSGVREGAARELQEELGFHVALEDMRPLGPSSFPCPGVLSERQFFFAVRVDPATRREPSLDGSALERDGAIVTLPLSEALQWCRDGRIVDSKTELGLRRLAEALEAA